MKHKRNTFLAYIRRNIFLLVIYLFGFGIIFLTFQSFWMDYFYPNNPLEIFTSQPENSVDLGKFTVN